MATVDRGSVTSFDEYLRKYLPQDAERRQLVGIEEGDTLGQDAARRAVEDIEARLKAEFAK